MAKPTILIVDDDPGIATLLKTIIVREGYNTLTAANADEGFRTYQTGNPDLVLLDLAMPGKDGIALARMIRAEEQNGAHTPIVFLTAHGKEVYPDDIDTLHITGHLMKPITPVHLRVALEKFLS